VDSMTGEKEMRGGEDLLNADYPSDPLSSHKGFAAKWLALSAVGSGFVWASVGQGSGELIFWPYLTAKYGLAFVGWILPACLLQYWVNLEIGRYTVVTGETIFSGFRRVHPFFVWLLGLMMIPTFLWFGAYASAGGTALAALTNLPVGWSERAQTLFWAYFTIACFLSFVFFKVVYRGLERFMIAISVSSLLGVFIACFHPSVAGKVGEYFSAYVRPDIALPQAWDPKDTRLLITAVTFAGMGGFFNLFYSYWLRDRGVGMAGTTSPRGDRLVGRVTSPIRGVSQTIPTSGFRVRDTEANRRSHKMWVRGLMVDNAIGVGINLFTVSLLGLLAYAILHPIGLVPEGWQIAVVQARFFGTVWGKVGSAIFLVLSALFLADSWPGVVDGVARMFTDFAGNTFARGPDFSFGRWYWRSAGVVALLTIITLPVAAPGTLLLLQGILNFVAMVLYCPLLIWLNFIRLPQMAPAWTRPGLIPLLGISVATLAYLLLFGWYVRVLFS